MGFTQKGSRLTRAGARAASWPSPTPRQGSKATTPAGGQRLNLAPVPWGHCEWPVSDWSWSSALQAAGWRSLCSRPWPPHPSAGNAARPASEPLSPTFPGKYWPGPCCRKAAPASPAGSESAQTEPTAWTRLHLCSERMVGGCALQIALATLTAE